MTNKSDSDRLKELTEVLDMQRNKLKICRLTMREHGIGHLYPGATVEYEENMKKSMEVMDGGSVQSLYTAAKYQQFKAQSNFNNLKKLLEFIESKGISAQEVHDYIRGSTKLLAEDEELEIMGNNPQTLSLSDDNKHTG